jgi:hypothetical protein
MARLGFPRTARSRLCSPASLSSRRCRATRGPRWRRR